jgi:hypothetical protein
MRIQITSKASEPLIPVNTPAACPRGVFSIYVLYRIITRNSYYCANSNNGLVFVMDTKCISSKKLSGIEVLNII